ncbi:hypothetical protein M8J77_022382 [Diaphorina citri]|nr:hypothetical protein M8J77_022382 [Diaphorina citri]
MGPLSFRPQNDFYNIGNLTRFGPASIPGYSMARTDIQTRRRDHDPTPGPGAYYPEHYAALGSRSPAFSLAGRLREPTNWKADLPAPNQYQSDICVTTSCLNKNAAKSFGIRWNERKDTATSGVPFYSLTNLNAYKRRHPTYRMAQPVVPNEVRTQPGTPGPSDYFPQVSRDTPAFSFGSKYPGAANTMRTECEYELI